MTIENIVPDLIVSGELGERWGIGIDAKGFLVILYQSVIGEVFTRSNAIPPKVAAHIDLFISQNYNRLNNQYGLPRSATAATTRVNDNGTAVFN